MSLRWRTLLTTPILLLAACSSVPPEDEVATLPEGDARTGAARAVPDTSTTAVGPEKGTTSTTVEPTRPERDGPDRRRKLVDEVLEEYSHALTSIATDPSRLAATGTAQRARWDAVVHPASPLHVDVLARFVDRQRSEHMVVLPAQGEFSYRHRPLEVEATDGDTIAFTWCGWSPGIGIDQRSGDVVDDRVAHARGTGQLRSLEGRWTLELLDQLEFDALPPGSGDPCETGATTLRSEETTR